MKKIPFSEKEFEVLKEVPSIWPGDPPVKIYNRPISDRENYKRVYEKNPCWLPGFNDGQIFCPRIIPDNISRGFVLGDEPFDNDTQAGGPDMFGIEWEWVKTAGGSMVRPGKPLLDDVNNWKEKIKFPDIDRWDWETSAQINKKFLSADTWTVFWLLSGAWFERLVSFMDFENAVMALIDEDQQKAVNELFSATTDLMCRIVDKVAEYFPSVDSICVHDDWGSQAQPFFSQETAMEMIVPHMKKLVEHIHSKGIIADLHSCGHIEKRVECFIAAGWDSWTPQPMNDSGMLFDKYGDKIILGVSQEMDPESSDDVQIKKADEFTEKFCKPNKPCILGYMFGSEAFDKEIYKSSRLAYLK